MMNDSRDTVMADQVRAERIKKILLKNGTYEEMAERTKIGSRTLLRIATGKTEPKFSDIIEIAKVTGTSVDWIAFGDEWHAKTVASDPTKIMHFDEEASDSHYYTIWNLRKLTRSQINAIAEQVRALDTWNYSRADFKIKTELNGWNLLKAIGNGDPDGSLKIIKSLRDDYGLNDNEIISLAKKDGKCTEKELSRLQEAIAYNSGSPELVWV
ncbi:helix-turn-helix domain-containing protein [Vibrio cyclitrophicus]